MDPWQEEDYAALLHSSRPHFYGGRPRGHDKSGTGGGVATTEMFLGPPGQQLFLAAADEDQARIVFDDVIGKLRRNPLLWPSVKVKQREVLVTATGSRLRVLSSDAPTAYGLRPDVIIADELAEWRGRALWESLWSAMVKRPRSRMIVLTTAGWDFGGVAREVWELAQREEGWVFSDRGQCASWIDPKRLEQQRRSLPPHVFARLHENRWVEGAGAFLTAAEVDGIFGALPGTVAGPAAIGLDLGISRDAAVAALVRRDDSGLVCIETLLTWAPRSGKVDLVEVEDKVAVLAARSGARVVADPWQAALLAQRLRRKGVAVVEFTFSAESRRRVFGGLLDLIRGGRLRSRPHEALRRELLGLEVTEGASGWRVDHRSGGHDDHAVAVALAAHQVGDGVRFEGSLLEFSAFSFPTSMTEPLGGDRAIARAYSAAGAPPPWELENRRYPYFPEDD